MASGKENLTRELLNLTQNIGRGIVHNLYPNDVEYYAMALELTDWDGNTIDYFIFPVMPNSVTKQEVRRIKTKKSASAITVIINDSYPPQEINIKGSFGRQFKVTLKPKLSFLGTAYKYSTAAGVYDTHQLDSTTFIQKAQSFNQVIKTGYGAIKELQAIIRKAVGKDSQGRPFRLYLYNPALGENYLVIPQARGLSVKQDVNGMNGIWEYDMNLLIMSPIDALKKELKSSSLILATSTDAINRSINSLKNDVLNFIQ